MKQGWSVRVCLILGILMIQGRASAGPLDIGSVESYVRDSYAPRAASQIGTMQSSAQAMLIAGAGGAQKPLYGGNDVAGVAQAMLKDTLVMVRNPTEFLSAMEFSVIGICYRITVFPPSIQFGPYWGYYWPTQVNEMADTRQSEYVPEAVFDLLDGALGLENLLYPHVQGEESFYETLGVTAPAALARAGRVAARNPDIPVPEKADVINLVERLPKAHRWHAGSDGTTNLKEWRYLPHVLQILYAEGGGMNLLNHKRRYSSIPILYSEMPLINDITRVAEWSNLLFPTVMGAPELVGSAGNTVNSQFGLKGNPGRCIGHNIWRGNTSVLPFSLMLGRVNQGMAYAFPSYNRDICTENIGADYPVTTSADVPVSRMPHMTYIRSLNLLGHRSLQMLTGGVRGGFFDYKKYKRNGWRADKIQFRDSNKDDNARFLMDRPKNLLWEAMMGDKSSWVSDSSASPESFMSVKHRPALDPSDPGRAISYQWSGFRICQNRMRPLLVFPITDDSRNPQITGSEEWPGGGGGAL